MGSVPGLGRSPGGGNGNLCQYSCLENPMDRGAWWAAVSGAGVVGEGHNESTMTEQLVHIWPQLTLYSFAIKNLPFISVP